MTNELSNLRQKYGASGMGELASLQQAGAGASELANLQNSGALGGELANLQQTTPNAMNSLTALQQQYSAPADELSKIKQSGAVAQAPTQQGPNALNQLMQQYGVSTPGVAPYSGQTMIDPTTLKTPELKPVDIGDFTAKEPVIPTAPVAPTMPEVKMSIERPTTPPTVTLNLGTQKYPGRQGENDWRYRYVNWTPTPVPVTANITSSRGNLWYDGKILHSSYGKSDPNFLSQYADQWKAQVAEWDTVYADTQAQAQKAYDDAMALYTPQLSEFNANKDAYVQQAADYEQRLAEYNAAYKKAQEDSQTLYEQQQAEYAKQKAVYEQQQAHPEMVYADQAAYDAYKQDFANRIANTDMYTQTPQWGTQIAPPSYARGGKVKSMAKKYGVRGYAEGDIVEIDGEDYAQVVPPVESAPPAPSADMTALRNRYRVENAALNDMMMKYIDNPSSGKRDDSEMYFRLASAFLSPTKTKQGFMENLGMAGKEMAEYSGAKRATGQEQMKMRIEAQKLRRNLTKDELDTAFEVEQQGELARRWNLEQLQGDEKAAEDKRRWEIDNARKAQDSKVQAEKTRAEVDKINRELQANGMPELNVSQSAATAYGMRMADAQADYERASNGGEIQHGQIVAGVEMIPFFGPGAGAVVRATPGIKPSPAQQQVEQAEDNFINAVLRRESGATIRDDEFIRARNQYFPRPGDSPEVIAQKKRNRLTTIEGMRVGAGPGGYLIGGGTSNNPVSISSDVLQRMNELYPR